MATSEQKTLEKKRLLMNCAVVFILLNMQIVLCRASKEKRVKA